MSIERPPRSESFDGEADDGEALREEHAPRRDAQQDQIRGALVGLEDLVGHALEYAGDVGVREDDATLAG